MTKLVRTAVRHACGIEVPRLIVPAQDGAAPVLGDEIAIQRFVEQDCGADGYTIQGGKLIAVRWRDGAAFPLKTYDIESC